MQKKIQIPFLILFLILSVYPAFALDPGEVNKTLLAATSPFEDMVGAALAVDDAGVKKALSAADAQATKVKAVVPAEVTDRFDKLLQNIHQTASEHKYQEVALTAVETFRLLVEELKPGSLKMPKEVYMLDYVGLKSRVLAATPPPNWEAMRQTTAHASLWWDAIASDMTDKTLQDAFSTSIGGLIDATKREDQPMLQFAIQMEMDMVDLLENYFQQQQ